MDPFTLIAGATALYNGIKSAVDAGQDVMDTAEKVGNLFAKIAQIVQVTSAPRKKKMFQSQAEYEAEAVKLYAVKAKAKQMQLDVKNMFVAQYGPKAWESILKETTEMRKEAARQAQIELELKEEAKKDAMLALGLLGGVILFAGILVVAIFITSGGLK